MNNNLFKNFFRNLTNTQKGALLICSGIILLVFLTGIFKTAFHYLILVTSLLLIIYGIIIGDFLKKLIQLIRKK